MRAHEVDGAVHRPRRALVRRRDRGHGRGIETLHHGGSELDPPLPVVVLERRIQSVLAQMAQVRIGPFGIRVVPVDVPGVEAVLRPFVVTAEVPGTGDPAPVAGVPDQVADRGGGGRQVGVRSTIRSSPVRSCRAARARADRARSASSRAPASRPARSSRRFPGRSPCAARRSSVGVCTVGSPAKPVLAARHWSHMTSRMFGCSGMRAACARADAGSNGRHVKRCSCGALACCTPSRSRCSWLGVSYLRAGSRRRKSSSS